MPLNVAAAHLLIGDVLSYRNGPFPANPLRWPGWLLGKAIAVGGRTDDVHTGMVDRNTDRELLALGMRLGRQKLKFLADEVAANPGLIDVYRIVGRDRQRYTLPHESQGLPEMIRRQICNQMRHFALSDHYGTLGVLRSSVYFVPGLRWAAPHYGELVDDDERDARPYCSQAISHAIRKFAGFPLLNDRPDRHMLPSDVASSPLLLKLFTLVPAVADPLPIEHYYAATNYGAHL